jgi:predicted naringenin-chalcone synthase
MKPSIRAIGTANPPHCFSQKEVVGFMSRAHQLDGEALVRLQALYRATGINQRYSVLSDYGSTPDDYRFYPSDFDPFPGTKARNELFQQQALPLAEKAVQDCLPQGFDTQTITHLIVVSCTGLYAPGLDIELVEALDLPVNISRTGINFMGCYGVFNALRVAQAFCESIAKAKVLIVSVELCSLHFQKSPTEDAILSNALFGDGAAAALVENASTGFQMVSNYCTLSPRGNQDMQWKLGNTGFEMLLSNQIPDLIESEIEPLIDDLLRNSPLSREDIDYFAIHPGGKAIIESIRKALVLSDANCRYSFDILRDYGNMSSASILFVLKKIWNNLNATDHNKKVLGMAFGPGLTLESMILSIANNT